MPRLALVLAQLDQTVGDPRANARALLAARASAPPGTHLVVTPELSLLGYPPEDLVLHEALIAAAEAALGDLVDATGDGGPALLIGTARPTAAGLTNAMVLAGGGHILGETHKEVLPNEGVFDEKRLFVPGRAQRLDCPADGGTVGLGVLVCEDMWTPGPARALAAAGAELFLVTNGSPFEPDKAERRLALARARAAETGLALAYLNRVGGQDELVFDGGSFAINAGGRLAARAPEWAAASLVLCWTPDGGFHSGDIAPQPGPEERLWRAMAMGLSSYVEAHGFPGVILGLSGGIDSALSAALAVDALGAARVRALMLPSRHTSAASLEDAAAIAAMLGIRLDTVDIEPAVAALEGSLQPLFDERPADEALGLARQNLQSRVRGLMLMAASNRLGPMLLTTGNKSEVAVGYATLYGDMSGGYSVLKDVWKTEVFQLARWRNLGRPAGMAGPEGAVMPERVILRPPSAELAPDQVDEDNLPPYNRLDPMLVHLVEERGSVDGLVARGFDPAEAARVERLVHAAEYKRRQAPPGVKLSRLHFGRDRRLPLMHGWRTA